MTGTAPEAITQADRKLFSYLLGWDASDDQQRILDGAFDHWPKMQRIAAHRRLTSHSAGEGLREADFYAGFDAATKMLNDSIALGDHRWPEHRAEACRAALLTPPSEAGSTTRSGGEGVNWSLPIEAIHDDGRIVPMVVAQLNAGANPGNDHWLSTADCHRFPGRPGSHQFEWASKDGALPSQPGWRIRNTTTPSPDASPDSGEAFNTIERVRNVVTEFIECARLRGDNELPHPCDDPKLWTARMIDAWGELEALADEDPLAALHPFSEAPAIVKEAGEVERLTGDIPFDAFMAGDVSRLTTTALPNSLRSMQSSYQRAWDDLAAALSASNAAQVSK